MSIESKGPGNVGNSYGTRGTNTPRQYDTAGVLKPDYQEFGESGVPSALQALVSGAGIMMALATPDSNGIDTAMMLIGASGKPGTVLLPSEVAITRSIPLVSNISFIGASAMVQFNGDIPDAGFSVIGGTRFNVSPGVTAMTFNNVDKGSDETDIAENALTGVRIKGITFIGGAKAIHIGALRAMGPVYSEFDDLFAFDQTDDYAFDINNWQHCDFGRMYTSTTLASGSGIRFGCGLSSALLPGNSTFSKEIYTYCTGRLNRSIVFDVFGPNGSTLNQVKVSGRLQGNRYGAATPETISMAFVSGSADVTVADSDDFALLQVGMPFVFESSAPTGLEARIVYFVISRGANTFQFAETEWATVGLTTTSTGSFTAKCSGWPAIHIRRAYPNNSLKNSDLGLWDAEAYGNVCAVIVSGVRNCIAHLAEVMSSNTLTALVTRDAEIAFRTGGTSQVTQDISGSYGYCTVEAPDGVPVAYSGGSFSLDPSYNGKCLRYSGTADITITIPLSLPRGFKMSIITIGATGIVTFAIAAGGALNARVGFRTLGQYSSVFLRNTSQKSYSLTGDLQV